MVQQIRKLLDRFPTLQIVTTTHQPYLTDQFAYDEVYLTERLEDGSALCAPLSRHPDLDRWRDQMAPGEFWSSFGESWIRELPDRSDA